MNYPIYTGMRTAGPAVIGWLGFLAALLALPLFLVAGWPLAGWALGAALFAINRGAAVATDHLARGKMQVTAVGITGVSFMARAWVIFGFLFVFAKTVDEHVGVVAAVAFLAFFTVDTLARTLAHVAGGGTRTPGPDGTA